MNTFTKSILATASALTLAFSASAQQRQVDLEVSITSPAANAVIQYNEQVNFTIAIKNNGPEDMISGDTIFYQTNLEQGVKMGTLQANVPAGQTIGLPLQFTNTNTTGTDQVANLCVVIFEPNSQLQDNNNNPVYVGYLDTDTSNNESCVNNVTLKSGATSLNDVEIASNGLVVYPNPATAKVGFRYTAVANEEVVAVVSDILGREVIRKNLGAAIKGAEATYELDITSLNAGNYILSVTNGSVQTIGRVTIK